MNFFANIRLRLFPNTAAPFCHTKPNQSFREYFYLWILLFAPFYWIWWILSSNTFERNIAILIMLLKPNLSYGKVKAPTFRDKYSRNALIWLCMAKKSRRSKKKPKVLEGPTLATGSNSLKSPSPALFCRFMSENVIFARGGIIFGKSYLVRKRNFTSTHFAIKLKLQCKNFNLVWHHAHVKSSTLVIFCVIVRHFACFSTLFNKTF